ncbi:MAG: hypothetical protein J0M24_03725 [Verrucomicrobia bacterium]|nr:hypothetical protein [Verrucomicrobiota bacterium]
MKRLQPILGASLVVFVVACVVSYFFRSDGFGVPGVQDGIRRLGWPLVIWQQGGFAHRQTFSAVALLADLALGVVAGVLISRLYSRVTHEPSAQQTGCSEPRDCVSVAVQTPPARDH